MSGDVERRARTLGDGTDAGGYLVPSAILALHDEVFVVTPAKRLRHAADLIVAQAIKSPPHLVPHLRRTNRALRRAATSIAYREAMP